MATFTVTTGGDVTDATDGVLSLREAIVAAQGSGGPDTITFADDVTVASLSTSLIITNSSEVTILGDRDGDGVADVSISGSDATRHFTINIGSLTLEGLRLIEGSDEASGSNVDGQPAFASITSSRFGDLSLIRTVFEDNSAVGQTGRPGVNGITSSAGGDGTIFSGAMTGGTGFPGTGGGDGGNGSIIRSFGTLFIQDSGFEEDNSAVGANGANGGVGGRGGAGGDAFGLTAGGGNGGRGGPGGSGGDGGDAAMIWNNGTITGSGPVAGGGDLVAGLAGSGATGGSGGAGGAGSTFGPAGSGGFAGSRGANGSNGQTGTIVNSSNGTSEIGAVDTLVFAHANDLTIDEGGDIVFNINRIGSSTGTFTVAYSIEGGAGFTQGDLASGESLTGTVEFIDGGTNSRTITIGTRNDTDREALEEFTVTLDAITANAASNGTVEFGTAMLEGSLAASDENPPTPVGPITGTANDDSGIDGTPGDDDIRALAGNDIVNGSGGSDDINGGPGKDTVSYDLARGAITQTVANGELVTVNKPGGQTDMLRGVERISFEEGRYVFDIDTVDTAEIAGDDLAFIYRIYDAAFARTPDEAGIRFWADAYNGTTLEADGLADLFVESPEYELRYPNASDEAYIEQLYLNALRRPSDAAGKQFWLDEFQSERQDRGDMLEFFAESDENIARNAENVDNGLFFAATDVFDVDSIV